MLESIRRTPLVPFPRRISIIFLSLLASIGIVACAPAGRSSGVVQFAIDSGSPADKSVAVRDLRFYVHNVELIGADGEAIPFDLSARLPWQEPRVALIDLVGASDADRNLALHGHFAGRQTFSGIRFIVGVPFALNHANPLLASAPLNRADLFWTWQAGYKFLRVDLAGDKGEWSFHLGSTGCASASAVRPPERPCAQPNLMHVELSGVDPLREPISVRVDELVESMRMQGAATCTGNYMHDPGCKDIFSKTGLEASSGACPHARCEQQLFGVSKRSGQPAS
jgi:uncharacterized repeat protein (TIGR04052 family)